MQVDDPVDGGAMAKERRQDDMNLIEDLRELQQRLLKLKSQEQAVVNEEEDIVKRIIKLEPSISEQSQRDEQVRRLWREIKDMRPFKTPLLLSLSLGKARFVLPEKQRLRYKKDYEEFKLWSVAVQCGLSCLQLFLPPLVVLDALNNFHLVYYYSTLTLREHIMVANGSHIRAWWRAHHYLCVIIAGIMLIWPPQSPARQAMRTSLIHFAIYASGIQVLQYRYQMRRLYTLRALARVGPMETTTESATVHIRNDLAFLLPFLVVGHFWQFYLAHCFYRCSGMLGATWHVPVLSLLFLMIGVGNLSAVLYTSFLKYFRL